MDEEIIKRKPKQFICLDKLFNEDDQLKTNTVLQMKLAHRLVRRNVNEGESPYVFTRDVGEDAGVKFRTI